MKCRTNTEEKFRVGRNNDKQNDCSRNFDATKNIIFLYRVIRIVGVATNHIL